MAGGDPGPSNLANKNEGEKAVVEFLAAQDLGLSESRLFEILKIHQLGTAKNLFAVGKWEEKTLHDMFQEIFPKDLQITVPQRYSLVSGLKAKAKMDRRI
jgi:hypothetical protein